MKWLIKILSLLIIVFLIFNFIFYLTKQESKAEYTVDGYSLDETLKVNQLNKLDNYYFELKSPHKINFQIFHNFNKKNRVIKNIYVKKSNGYTCIFPVFVSGIYTDIMCQKNNTIELYHNIKNQYPNIDKFAQSMAKYGYNIQNYQTNKKYTKHNTLYIYKKSLPNNQSFAIENYKGLTLINNQIKDIKIFNSDIYKKDLSIFFDKYYLVADYNSDYTFSQFILINIINGKKTEIKTPYTISFNSYIQGVVDNTVYLFDKDNSQQYKINIKNQYVNLLSEPIIYYKAGKTTTITLKEANEDKLFNPFKTTKDETVKSTGYNYIYSQNTKCDVYRTNIQNTNFKTKYFSTTDKNSIINLGNYIYYTNNTDIQYITDNGSKKILYNSELEFNPSIKFGVYKK